jgi:2-hydroxy fatty acid dioxygenase
MVHLLSWYFQIHWGHYLIEGAAPAVWQSVGGALTTAPLFAFYEGLWYVGLQSDLQHRVTRLVVQDYSTLLLGPHPEDKDNNNNNKDQEY